MYISVGYVRYIDVQCNKTNDSDHDRKTESLPAGPPYTAEASNRTRTRFFQILDSEVSGGEKTLWQMEVGLKDLAPESHFLMSKWKEVDGSMVIGSMDYFTYF